MSNSNNRAFTRKQFLASPAKEPPKDLQKLAALILTELGNGMGFVVLAFPLDGSREPRYVSNGTRESTMKLLRDFVASQDAKPEPPKIEGN